MGEKTAVEIDESFVPTPADEVVAVSIADELVLLRGWERATVLNATGALYWASFDGETPLSGIIDHLSEVYGTDRAAARADLVEFTRTVGEAGLLAGFGSPGLDDEPESVSFEPIPDFETGDLIADFTLRDLDGIERSLVEFRGRELLLVNWSPHCGYCSTIAEPLAALQPHLDAAGVALALVATGTAEANRALARSAGLAAPILLLAGDIDPFIGYGTPAAYHLGADGRLLRPMVFGADDVPSLAADLAGIDLRELDVTAADGAPDGTQYLLDPNGMCGSSVDLVLARSWAGTRVYAIGRHHVGIRFDSEETASVLDALFPEMRVEDPRAGHSYSIAISAPMHRDTEHRDDAPHRDVGRGMRRLNLLVEPGQAPVRSRSASRVLRALLWSLDDQIVGFDPSRGRVRVRATAACTHGGGLLLQPGLTTLVQIQPRLARAGIALADVTHPEIDLATAELVIPEPSIPHDPAVLAALDGPLDARSELPPVVPGRYPLIGWGVMLPGSEPVVPLSPAQAAAATLSFVLDTDDAAHRLEQLGALFTRIRGFGIWYHSEAELVEAVVSALR